MSTKYKLLVLILLNTGTHSDLFSKKYKKR